MNVNMVIVMTPLIAGVGLLAAPDPASGGHSPEEWTVVSGQQASYTNSAGQEIVLRGKLIVENYGKPNVSYLRVPYNYWLETGDQKVSLGINDRVFPTLDKKTVEVKGKMQKDQNGQDRMLVGWVRLLSSTAAQQRSGDSPPATPSSKSAP